jgi:hypothetical protein
MREKVFSQPFGMGTSRSAAAKKFDLWKSGAIVHQRRRKSAYFSTLLRLTEPARYFPALVIVTLS